MNSSLFTKEEFLLRQLKYKKMMIKYAVKDLNNLIDNHKYSDMGYIPDIIKVLVNIKTRLEDE